MVALQTILVDWFGKMLLGVSEIDVHTGSGIGMVAVHVVLQYPTCPLLAPSSHTSSVKLVFIHGIKPSVVFIPCFPSVLVPPGLFLLSIIPSPQRAI